MKGIKLLIPLAIFTILFLLLVSLDTYQHERAHQQIAEYHGCVRSEIVLHIFSDSYFICNSYKNRSIDMVLQEKELHALNEIKSYNDQKYMFMFYITGMMIIIWMMLR